MNPKSVFYLLYFYRVNLPSSSEAEQAPATLIRWRLFTFKQSLLYWSWRQGETRKTSEGFLTFVRSVCCSPQVRGGQIVGVCRPVVVKFRVCKTKTFLMWRYQIWTSFPVFLVSAFAPPSPPLACLHASRHMKMHAQHKRLIFDSVVCL